MSNPLLTSYTDKWYTPEYLIELVTKTLGGIDLDPASSREANQLVKAKRYWTAYDDSLSFNWASRVLGNPVSVYLNPPSKGKLPGNKSWAGTYWSKLMDFRQSGMMTDAIYMGFSINQLSVSQSYHEVPMCSFPCCIPSNRIHFVSAEGSKKESPTHCNVIVYVPGVLNRKDDFVKNFKDLGAFINLC